MALYDDHLREKVNKLPNNPGVYQYFDESGVIIYIFIDKSVIATILETCNNIDIPPNPSKKAEIIILKL